MQKKRKSRRTDPRKEALKRLPSVSKLLEGRSLAAALASYGTGLVTDLVREHLERLRKEVRSGKLEGAALERAVRPGVIAGAVAEAARLALMPRPRPVINATGVVIHTNLGRSTLSAAAAEQLRNAARGYLDLEYDVETGGRGNRLAHLEPLMRRLFPEHAFTVVNNNAAAILLCLKVLSRRREVVVSRGELVEIGGSFRVPDILSASGARLHEVGTTNRTRSSDYRTAISSKTGMILKVHTSNFRIVGFTEETTVGRLARLAQEAGVPLVVDWGSGDLVDLAPLEIRDEVPVARILEEGADLVTFSGDKLLGGPQAGFIVGRDELIQRIRRDPLSRVCRLDRLLLGALHQTLAAYVRGRAFREVPSLAMLALEVDELQRRASKLKREVARKVGSAKMLSVIDGVSRTGGGSSPTGERPTRLLAVQGPSGDAAPIERRLRAGSPPIIGRIQDGKLLLDLRTVLPEQDPVLTDRLAAALSE